MQSNASIFTVSTNYLSCISSFKIYFITLPFQMASGEKKAKPTSKQAIATPPAAAAMGMKIYRDIRTLYHWTQMKAELPARLCSYNFPPTSAI